LIFLYLPYKIEKTTHRIYLRPDGFVHSV